MTMEYDREEAQVEFASTLNVIAGLAVMISPWVIGFDTLTAAVINAVIMGAAVAGLAVARVLLPARSMALSWVNLTIGAWLIASPWVLSVNQTTGLDWTNVVMGAAIGVLALWSGIAGATMFTRSHRGMQPAMR